MPLVVQSGTEPTFNGSVQGHVEYHSEELHAICLAVIIRLDFIMYVDN